MKNIFITGLCLILLILFASCDHSLAGLTETAKSAKGEVTIRLLNPAGRTILPLDPLFSRFELTLQKEGGGLIFVNDTDGIDGSGVTVNLSEGNWTITLTGFQEIDGADIPAARGQFNLTVSPAQASYLAEIELKPFDINSSGGAGLFTFDIILPDADTAILSLKDADGISVDGFDQYDLINGNSGSVQLPCGFYDLSVILTKNGQAAGEFASVHIYSGLISPANIDLSGIEFTNKVYLAGKLGGIKIGTIVITDDAGNEIKSIELESNMAKRSDSWIIDIPAANIGKTVHAVLKFNGEEAGAVIPVLESKGCDEIDLDLFPQSVKYTDLGQWYSIKTADGGEIVLDFGFNVTANFFKLTFNNEETSIIYYPQALTAVEFNARDFSKGISLPITGFELYNAADRGALANAVAVAKTNCNASVISFDGSEIHLSALWVTTAVKDEYQNVIDATSLLIDDPLKTEEEFETAVKTLADATLKFNSAKKWGSNGDVSAGNFTVQDGFNDKFIISWRSFSEYKYNLYRFTSKNDLFGNLIAEINPDGSGFRDSAILSVIQETDNDGISTIIVTVSSSPGDVKYFGIIPIWMGNAQLGKVIRTEEPCMTLGTPVLSLKPEYSYSTVTAVWTPAQKADVYRIAYMYPGDADWTNAVWESAGTFERDADGNFIFSFRPEGYDDITKSGKELQVVVLAVNSERIAEYKDDYYTISNVPVKKLVGSAELVVSAAKALSPDSINVSWNAIEGANGYYVSGRQFDLTNSNPVTDSFLHYVTDAGFTLNDQAGDSIVQGYPYRFIVIPVINENDVTEIDYGSGSYALREQGGTIIYYGAKEQTGYAIGFAANVTATKGTYASSGNVNDGIRITWSKPYLLSDAGLNYMIYRREHNNSSWESFGPTGELFYVDNPARGIVYEYAVGILHHVSAGDIRGPSRPDQSSLFIESEKMKTDGRGRANMQGYMLPTVTMNNVSRGENADVNAVFGEQVTWNGSGIAYGDTNWGVDGYTVYVMNRNINAAWHVIADNVPENTVLLTPANTPSYTVSDGLGTTTRNALFVLRDYKHFFKARSFVLDNSGNKIYSPDLSYTYTSGTAANPYFLENDYVKWGARQVTLEEFAKIVSVYMAEAFRMSSYWALNTTWIAKASASTNYGGGGSFRHRHITIGGTTMHIEYSNWKQNMQTRAGDWMTFISIDGKVWASNKHSGLPTAYGRHEGDSNSPKTHDGRLLITGPADTPNLYRGYMHFGGNSTKDLTWTDGLVHFSYPSGTAQRSITLRGQDTPMPFDDSGGGHRVESNTWR